jgi:hypothetical protein
MVWEQVPPEELVVVPWESVQTDIPVEATSRKAHHHSKVEMKAAVELLAAVEVLDVESQAD